MMFSNMVAWTVFGLTSLFMLVIVYDSLRTKSDIEVLAEKLKEIQTGRRQVYSFWRVLVLFAVWVAAGVYIWG
jgi:hypothetical protein